MHFTAQGVNHSSCILKMLYYSMHSDVDIEFIMNIDESEKINYGNFATDMCIIVQSGVLNIYLFIFNAAQKIDFVSVLILSDKSQKCIFRRGICFKG